MKNCKNCKLHETAKVNCIPGIGKYSARYIFLVDQPTYDGEEPLSNPQERMFLFKTLQSVGVDLRDCYITYSVAKCFPGLRKGKMIYAGISTARACKENLQRELDQLNPVKIFTLGLPALRAYANDNEIVPETCTLDNVTPLPSLRMVMTDVFMQEQFKESIQRALVRQVKIGNDWGSVQINDGIVEGEILQGVTYVASDVETTGLNWWDPMFTVTHAGFYWGENRGIVFNPKLNPTLYDAFLKLPQIVHNAAYEGNIYPKGTPVKADTLLLAHLHDPTQRLSLEAVSQRYLNVPVWKGRESDWMSWAKRNAQDIYCTWELYHTLWPKFNEKERRLHNIIELPSAIIYGGLKKKMIYINREFQWSLKRSLEERLMELSDELEREYGFTGNPNSPQQVSEFLYSDIPVPSRAEGKDIRSHSTDAVFLAELSVDYPQAQLIREYRKVRKILSNYIYDEPYLRPDIRPVGTVSGRASGKDGIQTFPRGLGVRKSFLPSRGMWVGGDLSQIELVICAILSGDKAMEKIYKEGLDIHAETCKAFIGEVTKENRNKAKPINFLLLYGGSAGMLRISALKDYGIRMTFDEAKSYRDQWFLRYNGVAQWHIDNAQTIYLHKEISSPLGQRYPMGKVFNPLTRDETIRQAHNYPVQGTGAKLCELGLIEAWKLDNDAPTLTLHDAVYNDTEEKDAEEFRITWHEKWQEAIDNYWPIEQRRGIPIRMETKIGRTLEDV